LPEASRKENALSIGFGLTPGGGAANGSAISGTIGRYELRERIGAGGFATVFKAWDKTANRAVAIKACTLGADMHSRFFREAELAGGLHHPNITEIYECGMEGDTPFIVQELLGGEDLSALIARREPADLASKVTILRGVADALDYAHRSGVIHRDIKPANVRVLEGLAVKLMDFGIAKALGTASNFTKSGVAVGSVGYMSPEQVSGDTIDERSDIFGLGVLAYEMLAFRAPFRNDNLFRLLEMIVKEDPDPLIELAPDTPPALLAVVSRAMEKNPADRFASAAEMRDALSRGEARSGGRAPILVVDDDATVREGLVKLLEDEGYAALAAANGRDALALAQSVRPSLILLDLKMPVMDGWQFLAQWNSREAAKRCPVVLLSGLSFIRDAPGVSDFLSKPVDTDRLLACVRRLGRSASDSVT
jgi:CheY-like chemotaxis protein